MIKGIYKSMKNIGVKPAEVEDIHEKAIEDKIKENPDYPFRPMTEKERAEKAAFEKDRDDFIKSMDKFRDEFNKGKDEAKAKMDYILSNYTPGGGQPTINFLTEQANHLKKMGPYGDINYQEVMKLIDNEEKKMKSE